MNKLAIVFLSLVFSSLSFADTQCETLLNSARSNMQAIQDAFASNGRIEYVIDNLGNKPISCEDLNSAVATFEVVSKAGVVAVRDMGAAEQLKCKTDPYRDNKADNIMEAYLQMEFFRKQVLDAQTAQNCK